MEVTDQTDPANQQQEKPGELFWRVQLHDLQMDPMKQLLSNEPRQSWSDCATFIQELKGLQASKDKFDIRGTVLSPFANYEVLNRFYFWEIIRDKDKRCIYMHVKKEDQDPLADLGSLKKLGGKVEGLDEGWEDRITHASAQEETVTLVSTDDDTGKQHVIMVGPEWNKEEAEPEQIRLIDGLLFEEMEYEFQIKFVAMNHQYTFLVIESQTSGTQIMAYHSVKKSDDLLKSFVEIA